MKRHIKPLHAIEYAFIVLAAWKFRWMPLSWARFFAAVLAAVLSRVIGLRRTVAMDNLKRAFPEKSPDEIERIYQRCWRHFTSVGAEMARLPRMNRAFVDRWMQLDDLALFDRLLERGKGVLFVSGHFGNWEWLGAAMAVAGYDVTYVVTSQTNPLVEAWMDRMRRSVGIEIINRRDAVRGVLKALKRNRIVAILCDQDAHEAGVFVPYFNRPASTPRGPAVFHTRTGAPVVFGAAVKEADGKYRFINRELSFPDLSGDREADEERIMSRITAELEREVRPRPEQWLWLHRRWKTRPPVTPQNQAMN